jgi:hypothetical protein
LEPALIGSSNLPRSTNAVWSAIFGMSLMRRAAVSSTEYFFQAPDKKKNTIFDRSSAARS